MSTIHAVLWIDDEIHSTDAAVRLLELEGFHVDCTETGHTGVSLARQRAFDVIVLDLRLGTESGLDVLELLKDSGVTAPILVLTALADVESAVAAMKLGATDYRTKPFDAEDIASLLRRMVARRDQTPGQPDADLTEVDWLRIQCDKLSACVTKRQLVTILLHVLGSDRLTLSSFFGGAEALRQLLTTTESSVTLLSNELRQTILRAARRPPPQHPKLRDAIQALEQDGSKLSQRMFSRRVGLSRAYLSHLVTLQTGRRASEWCRAALMRTALRRVLGTSEQISQIAYAAGYQHAGQFDRDFGGMFGVSPMDLRRLFTSHNLINADVAASNRGHQVA